MSQIPSQVYDYFTTYRQKQICLAASLYSSAFSIIFCFSFWELLLQYTRRVMIFEHKKMFGKIKV